MFIGCGQLDIDLFCEYLNQYVMMMKTFGKIVEIGFSDIITKCEIIKGNRDQLIAKGEEINSLESLLETEINMGLGKVTGSNNSKLGFDKQSQFYTYVGSCRSTERMLRFLLMLQRIIENMYNNREESFTVCVRNAYDKELSRYHGFILRNTVKGIFYILPSRETFLSGITKEWTIMNEETLYDRMKEMIDYGDVVTAYLLKFFKDRDHFELE